MGLLSVGKSLDYTETKKYAEHVRRHGIKQFINIYHKNKSRIDRCFKWGDEIEYMIVRFDHKDRKCRLSLRSKQILDIMYDREEREGPNRQVLWRSEYGAYQLEATPGQPYGHSNEVYGNDFMHNLFNTVETNMTLRRREIQELLDDDEALLCIGNYPR